VISPASWTPWYQPFVTPAAPSPPDAAMPSPQAAPATADFDVPDATGKPAKTTTASIGVSPVVLAFLLRMQEFNLKLLSGTDGNDAMRAGGGALVDAGDGNDRIDVWSDSVVDAGAGDDVVKAWSGAGVFGGSGNDRIDAWSDSIVDAGSGDDFVRAWSNARVSAAPVMTRSRHGPTARSMAAAAMT
jgi:hypothetical protein